MFFCFFLFTKRSAYFLAFPYLGVPILSLDDLIAADTAPREEFLAALVRVPSDNPPGDCAPAAEACAVLLEGLGFTVERHPVPAALTAAHGMISAINLIVRESFGPGPVIALNAHGDVVPPGEGWRTDPYGAEIIDGWMHGRGAAVSKSDICSYAFALKALKESGTALAGTVELHITYDEETGGEIGPAWLLAQGLTKPDFAIAAGFSYAVVTAHNGCLHLEVTVTGKSAHAAKPETGADALAAATSILVALYAERDRLRGNISEIAGVGAPGLTVGLIAGGINTNVVPDKITLRLDRRITPDEDPAAAEAALRALITQAGAAPGITVAIQRVLLAEPLTPLPGSERLAEIICAQAGDVFGETIRTTGSPLYTDARHYAAAGIPIVLYGAGPRSIEEANAHRADERIKLTDLHGATEVIARSLAAFLAQDTGDDLVLLRRAFEVARAARAAGCHPFGALLAGPDGAVLMEQQNAYLPERDMTGHAERVLSTKAGKQYGQAFLRQCTLYSSAEPCAMCAGAIYWAGIGRVVYGMSEHDLKEITGSHEENPTLDVPCRTIFAAGQRKVEVVGPLLVEESKALHDGAWG
jgi:acetylornithine deacetylase/succinyl-diaminopimelate desuccinylase-like protein/tRNA(Arg) A34 adenosine deaminase TadA